MATKPTTTPKPELTRESAAANLHPMYAESVISSYRRQLATR